MPSSGGILLHQALPGARTGNSIFGAVTLAADPADESPGFQDFVIVHELLHLRFPNHGKLFKATMAVHVPDWRRHDIERNAR